MRQTSLAAIKQDPELGGGMNVVTNKSQANIGNIMDGQSVRRETVEEKLNQNSEDESNDRELDNAPT